MELSVKGRSYQPPVISWFNEPFEIEFKLNKQQIKNLKSHKYNIITIFFNLFRISVGFDKTDQAKNTNPPTFIGLKFTPTQTKYFILSQIILKETGAFYLASLEINKDNWMNERGIQLDCNLNELNDESLTIHACLQILPSGYNQHPVYTMNDISKQHKSMITNNYLRNITLVTIPQDIINLITKFYPYLNQQTITWDICDIMSDTETNEDWQSLGPFEICNLSWIMFFKPKRSMRNRTLFELRLHLSFFPDHLKSIAFNYFISVQYQYDDEDDDTQYETTKCGLCQISQDDPEIMIISTNVHRPSSERAFSDQESIPKPRNFKQFQIECYLNVLEMTDGKTQRPIHRYIDPEKLNEKTHYELEWIINDKYKLDIIKNEGILNDFYSNIFDNIWCLGITRNRINESANLCLQLCSLPYALSELLIDITINISTDSNESSVINETDIKSNYRTNMFEWQIDTHNFQNAKMIKYKVDIVVKNTKHFECLNFKA